MFIDASLRDYSEHGCTFITDDKVFLDSFCEECLGILEQIEVRPIKVSDFREYLKQYKKKKKEAIWFALKFSYRANNYISNRFFSADLFTALLYKKADEFGYDLKAATDGGYLGEGYRLIFMKPSAPAK